MWQNVYFSNKINRVQKNLVCFCLFLHRMSKYKEIVNECQYFFLIQPHNLQRPFAFSLIIYSNASKHKLCTRTPIAWRWISYLFRQILRAFSSWSCLLWQSVSSTPPLQWHALTLRNISSLPMILRLRVNNLMFLARLGCHHPFPFKIISINCHKYHRYDIATSVTYLK